MVAPLALRRRHTTHPGIRDGRPLRVTLSDPVSVMATGLQGESFSFENQPSGDIMTDIETITVMHGHPLTDDDRDGMAWLVAHPLYARLREDGHHVLIRYGRIMWLDPDPPGSTWPGAARIGDTTGELIHPADWDWGHLPPGIVDLLEELEAAGEAAGLIGDVVWDRVRYEEELDDLESKCECCRI